MASEHGPGAVKQDSGFRRMQKIEIRNWKLEIGNWKLENRNSPPATSPPRKRGAMRLWNPALRQAQGGLYIGITRRAVFKFRFSSFDFRFSIFDSDFWLLTPVFGGW